jgi:hypothetical protein
MHISLFSKSTKSCLFDWSAVFNNKGLNGMFSPEKHKISFCNKTSEETTITVTTKILHTSLTF